METNDEWTGLLAGLLISAFSSGAVAEGLSQCQPSSQSCEFYDCAESVYRCGSDGYFIKFAKRLCDAEAYESQSSASGRLTKLIENVRSCLQREVREFPTSWNCAVASQAAIDSHVSCFIESGFCDLSLNDVIGLSQGIDNLFEVTSFRKVLSMNFSILGSCGLQKWQIKDGGAYYGGLEHDEKRTRSQILEDMRFGEPYYLRTRSDDQQMSQFHSIVPYYTEFTHGPFLSEELKWARKKRNDRRRDEWLRRYR